MEVKRIQSFSATINGIEFTNERRFDVVEYYYHLSRPTKEKIPHINNVPLRC